MAMITFGFTLNTDADTFCTWLKDRSEGWRVAFTAPAADRRDLEGIIHKQDAGTGLDLQKTSVSKRNNRTTCSFDVVKEIAPKEGLLVKGVIQLLLSPAARAGQVDIRAVCRYEWALVCFSYVLKQIANAYPEADVPIRKQQEEQMLSDLESLPATITLPPHKRGRQPDPAYDKAYQSIKAGVSEEAAFQRYCRDVGITKPTKADRYNFRRAMKYREKNDPDN